METKDAPSITERLRSEFCPPLDTALLYAILLDFPDPPSEGDKWRIREMLTALSAGLDPEELDSHNLKGQTWAGSGETTSTSRGTSELESALEVWSLDGADPDPDRRFWGGSQLSTTSGEEGEGLAKDLAQDNQPDDPLAFLANVFPHSELETLEARLAAAEGNIETVVDELLSQGFIISLDDEDPAPAAASIGKDASGGNKQQRKRLKAAQRAASTMSLTSPTLVQSPPVSVISSTTPITPISEALPSDNRWASLSSHSSNLSSLLHIPAARITSVYHSCSSSLPLTLSTLLTTLSSERPFLLLPDAQSLKTQLAVVLPSVPGARLEILLSATEADVADSMDLERTINEIERTEGSLPWSELLSPTGPTNKVVEVVRHRVAPAHHHPDQPEFYSSADCAAHEQDYVERRNEAMRSAARHFQRGGNAQRGAAYYWADEGRKLETKRRVWADRGAKALIRERRLYDRNTVDLHGLTHAQTVIIVREACNTWWSSSSSTSSHPPLRIITGIGRHSTNQTPVLMPAVTKLLDKEGWRWKWDGLGQGAAARGAVLVTGVVR